MVKKTLKILNGTGIIFVLLLFSACSNKSDENKRKIKWSPVCINIEKPEMCQIITLKNKEFLLFVSHFLSKGGGYKLINLKQNVDVFDSKLLLKISDQTISNVNFNKNSIAMITDNFENGIQNSKLLISRNNGVNWVQMTAPMQSIRKVCCFQNTCILEGNLEGTGQVLKTVDNGNYWKKINTLNRGYKSFYLLNNYNLNEKILCIGSTKFNDRNLELLLFNSENESISKLLSLNNINCYIKPISLNRNLHCILIDNVLNNYLLINGKFHFQSKCRIPDCIGNIKDVFIRDDVYIITFKEDIVNGKEKTWISYNKGEKWHAYLQGVEFQLVFNQTGELFMSDMKNNIFHGVIE